MLRPGRPRRHTEADVVLGKVPPETVGLEIVHKLAAKGFCVIAPGFEDHVLQKALEEVQEFDMRQKWGKVNAIIQDGLLGSEGSCLIAELESPDVEVEDREDGEMLMKLDYTITHFCFRIEPYLDHLGVDITHRSVAVLNQTGEPDEDEESTPLTEKTVMKWLAQFLRHKIMVIVFLGPTSGTLELLPYNTEDTEPHEIYTTPGMVVILRPDLMSHKFYSPGKSISITSFFMTGHISKFATADSQAMIPAARELDEWTLQRLRELKEETDNDLLWNPDIPRDWQHAMNHIYHKGQMVAVRGSAVKSCQIEEIDTFWRVSTGGPDYVTEVPLRRWDHTDVFDPDLESWRYYKSYCRHGSFMEGIEMFDCKMFSMSPNEAKVMDPHQRLILEIGYQSLVVAGMRKNTLVNSACGVYVGCGNGEWGMVPKEESGAFGATGGALSISSGRFSFTLGLKGPSMTLDTEASSGGTAIHLAADSMERKGRAAVNELAVAIGASMCLSPVMWPTLCAMGSLSREGRCFSFDASAAGFVRGDACASVAMRLMREYVDGTFFSNSDDEQSMGSLAGSTMNNNGRGSSLTAPSGPAEQEAIADAVRNANISVYDVDSVEAFGAGCFLADAIEVSSLVRAHRTEDIKEPLALTATKTSVGNQIEPSGIIAFLKTLQSAEWGAMTPNLHLRQANAHIEAFDQPGAFVDQMMEYQLRSTFSGNMSRGNGGSNTYLLSWGQVSNQKMPMQSKNPQREILTFWPGGGGELEPEKTPSREYSIVGSFGQWPDPRPMEQEGDNAWGYTVTLGENRWEWFVIWLDADPNKVLHPGHPNASKDFPVLGPVDDPEGACWMINARPENVYVPYDEVENISGEDYALMQDEYGQQVAAYSVSTADMGYPGDLYRVHLRIAGKWRTVTWERIKLTPAQIPDSLAIHGIFYVSAGWRDWELLEMVQDWQTGFWCLDVKLTNTWHEFQIVRNKDWRQVFYPDYNDCKPDGSPNVLGPDSYGSGAAWLIRGITGQSVRIEFQRELDGDRENVQVSWRPLGEDRADQLMLEEPAHRYVLVGSWDDFGRPHKMRWDGNAFRILLKLGPSGKEHFHLLMDGERENAVQPNRPDAVASDGHTILANVSGESRFNWMVGEQGKDAGQWFEIALDVSTAGKPEGLRWSRYSGEIPPAFKPFSVSAASTA